MNFLNFSMQIKENYPYFRLFLSLFSFPLKKSDNVLYGWPHKKLDNEMVLDVAKR